MQNSITDNAGNTGSLPFPRLRPTAFGSAVMVMIVITLVMASNYSNNLLYIVACIWLALMLTSGIHALFQFHSVRSAGWQYGELFASIGNPVLLRVDHQNFPGELFLQGNQALPESQRYTWQVIPENPGRETLHPPRLCAVDPLKLWCFSSTLPPLTNPLVLACPIEHQLLDDYLHRANSHHKEPEDIAGFRRYQPGDDYRHIDWSATARSGKVISRQWEGNQLSSVFWLDWDNLSLLPKRQRQETLTAWVIKLFEQGHDWGLRLQSLELKPDSTRQHRSHCLQVIAEIL